jgi:hypothetical protein
MGNVEVAISLVLVETGNVKMTTIGRQEGNIRGGLLDVMKDIASWDVVLTCFCNFSYPTRTHGACEPDNW